MHPSTGRELGVLELTLRIRDLLQASHPDPFWLKGSVSGNPRSNQKGHIYFQLVERIPGGGPVAASIDCALFAGARAAVTRDFARAGLAFQLSEGLEIRALGRIDIWPPSGRVQFIVEKIDPASLGDAGGRILRALIDRMASAGLKDLNSRLALPVPPLKVGLVTAPGSAAMEDFVTTLRESGYPFEVFLCASPMQGEATASGVVNALERLAEVPDISVIVITRGGGSAADLSWFNDERIGRAIAACPVPVVSGIGHEVDSTLPDFVCHTRAKTPTHAASLLVDLAADASAAIEAQAAALAARVKPRIRLATERIEGGARQLAGLAGFAFRARRRDIGRLEASLAAGTEARLSRASSVLAYVANRLGSMQDPGRLEARRICVEALSSALPQATEGSLDRLRMRLGLLEGNIDARSPRRMMALGWALVRDSRGVLLRSRSGASVGDPLTVLISDGSLGVRVESIAERET